MVYDCFPFFNELDLLEIRMHELDPVVDRFVIVEATRTFQREPKPLHFSENRARFSRFDAKIIHVVVDRFPGFFRRLRVPTPWDYSNFQKDQVARGLRDCRPGDQIIISDLDEIPRADKVREFRDQPGAKVFQQRLSNFYFNCVALESPAESHLVKRGDHVYWRGSVMVDFEQFRSFRKTRKIRDTQGAGVVQVEEGGWHFSFLGDVKAIQYKLRNWEHAKEGHYSQDYLADPQALKKMIEEGADLFGRDYRYGFIPLDDSFPRYLLEHRDRFAAYIKE